MVSFCFVSYNNSATPFEYEGGDIINIVTKAVVPENVQNDLAKVEKVGSKTLKEFLESGM